MNKAREIRNRLIDRLMTINNTDYLTALEKVIATSNIQELTITLTEEQKLMLTRSDDDIKHGRIIDQDSLNEQELEWLKEK
ncbi:hypothetical protein U3A58_06355 [Algoriphagus sp. C2-6-M1]|uniref:hypothetical protein n=1 Tax=Algoriphagus persicinus TaxID=3108754 RepID=UPI002B36ABD8|nr:hypothetical protein [Algoriphagus sp. C2-6-M1]MEB2780006.1 hypothetical protein [Algoriphagus sp. C2-6-M1]